jgi:hypothetical protein
MYINILIIYLFYISFNISFSFEENNNNNYNNSKVGLIVSLIISIIFTIIIIFLIFYCCCKIATNSVLNNDNQLNRRNNIHSNPMNSISSIQNNNRQYFQTYNINSERLNLNSEKNSIIFQQHFLFQNIMKPEIFSERFKSVEKNCSICLLDFVIDKSKICITNCHHIFHFYCLKKYVLNKKGKKCPICNDNFFKIFENIKIDEKKIKIIPLNEKDNPLNIKIEK